MSSDNNSTCSEATHTQTNISNRLNWVGTILEVHPSDIPVKINEIQTRLHTQLVRQWRQHITGDPERYFLNSSRMLNCSRMYIFTGEFEIIWTITKYKPS